MTKILPIIASAAFIVWMFLGLTGLFSSNSKDDLPEGPPPPKGLGTLTIKGMVQNTSPLMLGGVQMNEGDQQAWVKNLVRSGMNTVEVTVYAQQGRWFDNNLWFGDVSDATLEEIRTAKAAGMKVVLILRLQMDHSFPENAFLWHGMVYPETAYLLNRWFENYGRFARMWASVAESEGVDVLVIGSELNALFSSHFIQEVPGLEDYFLSEEKQTSYQEKVMRLGKDRLTSKYLGVWGKPNYTDLQAYLQDRSEANRKWAEKVACVDSTDQVLGMNRRRATQNFYWEKLIWSLRRVYNGKLTVAANFDNFEQIKFWRELDFVGINAYFPLRRLGQEDQPMEALFEARWKEILEKIAFFQDTMGIGHLPVLFTELGYTKYSGSTLAPWQGDGFSLLETEEKDSLVIWDQQPVDVHERNAAVRALHTVTRAMEFPLAGILYWKFTSWKHQEGEDPFALLIGSDSRDSLQNILGDMIRAN